MDTATAQPENDVNPGFPSYNAIGTVTAEVLKGDGCILLVRACWNEQTYTGILVLDPDRQHQWSNALLLRKAPRMTPPSTPTGSQSQKLPPAVNEPRIYNTRQRARTNRLSLPCFGSEADAIGQSPCAPALEDNSEPFVQPLLPRGTPPVLDSPRVSTGESRIFPLEERAFVKETRQPNASERSTDNPAQHASGSAVSEAEKQHRPKCLARKLESEFQQGLHSVIMQTAKLCIPENSSLKGDTQTDNTRMYSGSHATKTITEDPEQNNTVRPYRQAEKSLESSCQVAGPITLRKVNSIQQKPLVTSSVSGDRRSLNATPTRSTANTEHTSRPLALEEHEYVIQKDRKSTSSLSPKSPNAIPTKRIADKKKPSRFSIRFRPSLLAGEGPSPADGQSVDFMLETSNLDSEGSSSVNSAASIQSFNQTSAATGGKNPIPVGKRKRRYNKGSYLSPDKIRAKRMQAKRRQARAQTPAGTAQNKEKERTQASGVDTAGPDDCQSNSATSLPCTSQNYDADSQLCFDPTQLKQCSSSESGTPESGISLTGFPSSSVTDTTQGATSLTGFPSSSVTDTKQRGTSRRSTVFERKSQHRAARYGSEDGDGAKPLSAHSATQPSPRLAGTKRKMENTSETVCQQEGTLLTNQEIPERHHNHDKKKGKRTVLS